MSDCYHCAQGYLCPLAEVTKERDNLRKLVGWSDGKLDIEMLLNERDQLQSELDIARAALKTALTPEP